MTIQPLTPEWHEARRKGIGASEIAAVLGISPWESPFSLYWRKVEGWQVEETEGMRTGTALEPAIAMWWCRQHADEIESMGQPALMVHPDYPWALATPDRLIEWQRRIFENGPTAESLLELKWTGSWDGWGEAGSDDVPVHYRAQLQWQCFVAGMPDWWLAALGPNGFREYHGHRDERDITVMVEAGRRFMDRIERQDPPPLDDHHATVTALKLLHPDLVDETAVIDDRTADAYLRAAKMVRLAERIRDRYEAQIRVMAGPARTITTESGRKVATHVITDVAAEKEPRGPHRKDYLLASLPKGKRA